jgi:uncharacterized protein (DUF433 family)
MTTTAYPHIAFTPEGRPYVEGTRIKVELIAIDRTIGGMQPEEIAALYPPLAPGQVYSALAYYYDHKDEMDRRIAEGEQLEQEIKAKYDSSPKLREQLKARGLLP